MLLLWRTVAAAPDRILRNGEFFKLCNLFQSVNLLKSSSGEMSSRRVEMEVVPTWRKSRGVLPSWSFAALMRAMPLDNKSEHEATRKRAALLAQPKALKAQDSQ